VRKHGYGMKRALEAEKERKKGSDIIHGKEMRKSKKRRRMTLVQEKKQKPSYGGGTSQRERGSKEVQAT